MLQSSEQTWGFLHDPLREAAQKITAAPDLTGEIIGSYRIVRMLGEGGMCRVYLAERPDDLYQQQVAIKLVQTGAGVHAICFFVSPPNAKFSPTSFIRILRAFSTQA